MREGWIEYKFNEVATAVKGKLPKAKNEDGVGIPYLTAKYLRSGKPDYWIQNLEDAVTAENGDCLILWDGAGAGDLFSAHRGVVSSTMAVVTTQNSDILREFLTVLISSKAEYIKETCRGTTVPHVSPDAIANMDLRIPPLPEQKRIVDLISTVDSYLESLRTKLTKSISARNSALENQLDSINKTSPIFRLEELCATGKSAIVDGPFGANLKREDYLEQGVPVLKIQNIKQDNVVIKKMDYVSEEKYQELRRHSFQRGDIVMTKLGDPLGLSAIVREIDKGLIVADLVRIRPDKIDAEFLCMQLNSAKIQNYINRMQKGSTRPRVNLGMIREMPIAVPSESEINDFITVFVAWKEHNGKLEETIHATEQLRLGLLSDLLSGNHEIPNSYDKVIGVA